MSSFLTSRRPCWLVHALVLPSVCGCAGLLLLSRERPLPASAPLREHAVAVRPSTASNPITHSLVDFRPATSQVAQAAQLFEVLVVARVCVLCVRVCVRCEAATQRRQAARRARITLRHAVRHARIDCSAGVLSIVCLGQGVRLGRQHYVWAQGTATPKGAVSQLLQGHVREAARPQCISCRCVSR